jgi:HSP20 family protein
MSDTKYEVEKTEAQTPERVERTRHARTFSPRVDIYEDKNEIYLIADIPGASEEDVDITLEKNVLTLRADVEATPVKEHSLAYAEYDVGDYERSFTLSDEIDRDKISATVKGGVLHVTLPKAAVVKERKITVKAG